VVSVVVGFRNILISKCGVCLIISWLCCFVRSGAEFEVVFYGICVVC